jgi:hypothetical protein
VVPAANGVEAVELVVDADAMGFGLVWEEDEAAAACRCENGLERMACSKGDDECGWVV